MADSSLLAPRARHRLNRWLAFLYGPIRALVHLSIEEYWAPVDVFCSDCGRHVSSRSKWRCGRCGDDHLGANTSVYSFLHRCHRCSKPPTCYICPHCGILNLLDDESDARFPAEIVIERRKESIEDREIKPQIDPMAAETAEIESLRRRIEKTNLEIRYSQLRRSLRPKKAPKITTAQERYEEHERRYLELDMLAREKRAENMARFKDDPDRLERAEMVLRDFLEREQESSEKKGTA